MTEILTAAQMRAIEQTAIDSGAVTGLDLMERAGAGVVAAVLAEWPDLAQGPQRAVVLCGPGNNGGDGFVVARLLAARGWTVDVHLFGDPATLPPDAGKNCQRWGSMGDIKTYRVAPPPLLDDRLVLPAQFDLLVDALFGTGLARPFGGVFAMLATPHAQGLLRAAGVRRVAVDVPTGLCADSGKPLGPTLAADLTVSFHSLKPGHVLAEGPRLCGRVVIHEIGLARSPVADKAIARHILTPDPATLAKAQGHKFNHGHALILSGGAGRTGAARLAARAALRVGAGLVTLGVPDAAQIECAAQVTAIMLTRTEDADGLAGLLQDARLNALCLGPGLGIARARDLVPVALAQPDRGVVLDADALTAYADAPAALFAALHPACVLTPHGGEFARLFPDLAARLAEPESKGPAYSKLDATRAAAARAGCVLLFKGSDTVIAAPSGRAAIHAAAYDRAAPWLATAGAGDVLAGIITGLIARGFDPFDAACTGAWLHVQAALSFGPGLIAEDLPEELPGVLRSLGVT